MYKQGHNLLLVDDDADDRYILHQAFSDLQWTDHLKIFSGGQDLLAYLNNLSESYHPSLIAFDYNMQGMNGGELLFYLKKDSLLSLIPVVIYTKGMKNLLREKLLSLGAHSCYEKGDDPKGIFQLANQIKSLSEELIQEASS